MRISITSATLVALLLPACGVGLPKVYPDPSSPEEEDGRAMTASQDPLIKTQACEAPPSSCARYFWGINFVLPMPAATSGWIVQEISQDYLDTNGGRQQRHYWEGFYVAADANRCVYFPVAFDGSPLGPDDIAPHADDTYSNVTRPNTMDVDTFIGKAKFYEGTLPADFIRPNDKTSAGDRRSTTTQPLFWDGTGTDHNLAVSWDCTAGNDILTMLPTPGPASVCPKRPN